jgi:hypothetical protein
MGKNRKKGKSTRRSNTAPMSAVSFSVGRAPFTPPARQLAANWHRVLQERVDTTPDTVTNFQADDFFGDRYNTTGFASLFVHSITVWSSPTNPVKEDSIRISPHCPSGTKDSGWSSQAFAGQVNRSAVLKVVWPQHLSGPYQKTDNIFALTTTARSVIVEIDATFC